MGAWGEYAAVRRGVLCGPGCWVQLSSHLVLLASGCRCLERGICRRERVEQLSLGRGKVRLSQFLPQGWGSCAVGWGCSGSPRLHVGKHKSFPCPSRPARVGAGVPPELLEHLWLARVPERSPGRRPAPQHRALFLWGGGAASGSQQDPEPPQGRLQHRGG